MAHKIAVSIETVDIRRRNEFLEALCELLGEHVAGADEAKLTFERQETTSIGKRTVKDTVTITEHDPISFADLEAGADLRLPMDSLWSGNRAAAKVA